MPFQETSVADEKLQFIAACLREPRNMRGLCEAFGISRQWGYELLRRPFGGCLMRWFRALLSVWRRERLEPRQQRGSGQATTDSIVDRYPLSYGQEPDPISTAARVEIELQKSRRGARSSGVLGG